MKVRFLKSAFAVSLFVNLIVLTAGLDRVIAALAAIPPAVATFVTGVGGLLMIAWQTNRGLKNLIRAQAHRSKIERSARIHAAELANKNGDEQGLKSKKTLAAIIHAELEAVFDDARSSVSSERAIVSNVKDLAKSDPDGIMNLYKFYSPLFDIHNKDIGIFGKEAAYAIIQAYRVKNLNDFFPDGIPYRLYEKQVEVREQRLAIANAWAGHAVDHLKAIQDDTEKPGPFRGSRHISKVATADYSDWAIE